MTQTDRDTLLALAERVEQASGPDRGIDGDIAAAIGEVPGWATTRPSPQRQPELFTDGGPGLRARTWLPPKYTASLDAAMGLLTEGSEFDLTNLYGVARAHVDMNSEFGGAHGEHLCGNVALALTAAALKASAQSATLETKDAD